MYSTNFRKNNSAISFYQIFLPDFFSYFFENLLVIF